MMGIPPHTAASYPIVAFGCLASSCWISGRYCASNALLAVTTCFSAAMAAKTSSLAAPTPPMSSTTQSISGSATRLIRSVVSVVCAGRVKSRSLSNDRHATVFTTTSTPICPIRAACLSSRFTTPPPTVPAPAMPTRSIFVAAMV